MGHCNAEFGPFNFALESGKPQIHVANLLYLCMYVCVFVCKLECIRESVQEHTVVWQLCFD